MAELTRFAGAFPRAIPALVAGIQRDPSVGGRGWLDAGDTGLRRCRQVRNDRREMPWLN